MIYNILVIVTVLIATTVALNGSRGNGHGPPDQCHSPNAMVNEDCERLIPDIPLPCFKPNMIRMNLVMFELVATGGALYNFTEPRMLCDGTISSIQYCFMASETMERQDIFRFLVIKQSHQLYTLDYDVNVTLSDTSAQLMRMVSPIPNSKLFYCDKMQLQYRLFSPYNYSFGIRATNSNISLLRFKEGVTFPQVSIPATEFSFQVDDFTDYIESTDFAFRDSTLLLLRLQIDSSTSEEPRMSPTRDNGSSSKETIESDHTEAMSTQQHTTPGPSVGTTEDSALSHPK